MALVATMLPRTGLVHENSRSNRRPKCHLNLDHHVSLLAGSTQRSQTIEGPLLVAAQSSRSFSLSKM